MKGLILSGGYGTRLRPITYSQQKQLIPIANKPVIFYAIQDLISAGIDQLGIVVGPNKHQVIDAVTRANFNAKISFIEQDAPRGLAHAIKISREFIADDPFVMYLGDNLLKSGISSYVKQFLDSDLDAFILLTHHPHPEQFGVAKLDSQGRIIGLIEKPRQPPSDLVLIGIYMFRNVIFKAVDELKPSWRGELEITDAIQYLIDHGYRVGYQIVSGWWKDTGKPEDILEANRLVLEDLEPYNLGICERSSIQGRVGIGEGTLISESVIRGPAIIGRDCKISRSYIGPYTSLGNDCIIEGAELENCVIMDGTKLRANLKLVDSLIGRNVSILTRNMLPRGCKIIVGDDSHLEL